MKKVYVEIEGVKPFIFHKFNIEQIQALSKPKTGSAGNDPDEWKRSFFYDDEDKLYIPSNYLFSAFKNGSVHTKVGRGSIQKTWISAVTMDEEKVYFNRTMFKNWQDTTFEELITNSSEPVYIDIRMVSNPNTKGKNVRYRVALSPGWVLKFHMDVDDSLVSMQQTKKIIEDTGKMQGLADGRTLGYGRFKLNEFSHEELK